MNRPRPARIKPALSTSLLLIFALLCHPNSAAAGGLTCDDISCAVGYHCVESPDGPKCVANTCEDVHCGPGYWCDDSPSGPICIPNLTCDFVSCAEGYHCVDTPQGPGCQPNDPVGVTPSVMGYEFFMAPTYPNPSRGEVSLGFVLPVVGRTTLRVYDVAGRTVRVLLDGELPAGAQVVRWDRRSNSGALVQPGLYFSELRQGAQKQVRRMILTR